MKAVIIDDEKSAVSSIELTLKEYCPEVDVVATATSAKKGIEEINTKNPDLVFLDIQMPHMSGIELLEVIGDKRSFEVVFVTAFNDYAIKAFKLSAIDYLLKPLNISELVAAVKKISERKINALSLNEKLQNLKAALSGKLTIPTSSGREFLTIEDIIRIEADGSYSKIYCINCNPKLVSKSCKEFQTALENQGFFRVHKSHLINLKYIKKYNPTKDGGTIEMTDGSIIEIARSHKAEFTNLLNNISK